jgi:hypothetical protein
MVVLLLDINLLKPSRIGFVQDPAPPLTLPDGVYEPKWLEYIYRTAIEFWGFQIKPIRERRQAQDRYQLILKHHKTVLMYEKC